MRRKMRNDAQRASSCLSLAGGAATSAALDRKKGPSHAGAARKSREETPKKGCRARDAIACSTGINLSRAVQQTRPRTFRAAQIRSYVNDRVC